MKVLLLSQFFSTTRGGGEHIFSLIAKKLAENKHKVWIITNKIIDEEYNVHENVKLVFVPPTLEYKGGLPPSFSENLKYSLNAVVKGFKIIRNEKIDLIHSNNFSPALAGSILSSLTSKPHITTIHDVFSLCGKDYWKRWAKQNNVSKINSFLAPFFERLLLKLKHDAIHTVSETTKNDLLQFGSKKQIYVIHNAVNSQNFSDSVEPNRFQFIYVGRLVFYKNLEVIIKALNIIKNVEPDVKLIIVGNGPHRKELEKVSKKLKTEQHVEFKGHVSSEEKDRLIASSHALLFPSLCEGFGLVILEAFSQKRPVLVSDIKPMSDIVDDEKTGYVLNPYDENEWSKKMIEMIRNPERASQMGLAGLEIMKKKFSIQDMYEKIIKMYANLK